MEAFQRDEINTKKIISIQLFARHGFLSDDMQYVATSNFMKDLKLYELI